MIHLTRIAVFALALFLIERAPFAQAAPQQTCNGHAFRGSAQWTQDPPAPDCGPFHTLLVHTTQADPNVVEVIYQFGNTCDNSFSNVFGTGLATVSGNLKSLNMSGTIATSDGRSFIVNVTLTGDVVTDRTDRDRTVSATAQGTVLLDGTDITGGVPTTNASITRSKC